MKKTDKAQSATILLAVSGLFALAHQAAQAYPEGAPWGTASPAAPESCSNCHYDYEPVNDSRALRIDGLPRIATPGAEYELVVRLNADDARVSGFQLLALAEGRSAGYFRSDDDNVESIGSSTRSTRPETAADGAAWSLTWKAPQSDNLPIVMYLAANASNDDQSPLGDTIHYRTFVVRVIHEEPKAQ